MATPSPSRTALLLIDIQHGLNDSTYWGHSRSNPAFESNIPTLLAAFRAAKAHIIHIVHHSLESSSPLHPSSPGARIQSYAAPLTGEPIMTKSVNSALIGTELQNVLRSHRINRLVICGLTTDHCVSTTTRMAANLKLVDYEEGGKVVQGRIVLVGDATAAWQKGIWDAETVHAVHLASLDKEFCEVLDTEDILKEIAGDWKAA